MAKICIDPGHFGKYNRCPAIPEYYESEMVWELSQLEKKYLEELGHTVILTRTNPAKDMDLVARGRKSKGCDLFISNHSNAVGSGMNENVNYAAIYHLVDDKTTTADDKSVEFAKAIGPVVAATMGVTYKILSKKSENDRNGDGTKNDNYYGVLHGARLVNTPGVIIEHSFHTNTKTAEWLLNRDNLDKLAKAEAEAIDKFFGGSKVDPIPEPTPVPNPEPVPEYFKVKVEINNLNIRKGPGTNFVRLDHFIEPGIYTIVDVQSGQGSNSGWGKLKSGIGWISLDFAKKI